jgi:hypothetical protein
MIFTLGGGGDVWQQNIFFHIKWRIQLKEITVVDTMEIVIIRG